MYPSGVWQGYWDQIVFGRQRMENLQIHFNSGKISGHGQDIVGKFVFSGSYDNQGKVLMIKEYLGRHQVHYLGEYDGEGTIFGVWKIGESYTGSFAISLQRAGQLADAPIQDL